jgi:hypothetical protein
VAFRWLTLATGRVGQGNYYEILTMPGIFSALGVSEDGNVVDPEHFAGSNMH